MSRIKAKNTLPEIVVRKFLKLRGYKFRTHVLALPGKPDFVLSEFKIVIFVHGCFWHRHKHCKFSYTPKSRVEFWKNKFVQNVNRFSFVKKKLSQMKWKVITIWECEIKSQKKLNKILPNKSCKLA